MEFFPYPPRPFQTEAVAAITATSKEGGHLVLEAPTGSGKTAMLLAGALEAALAHGRRVLYVTRTNSQQEQAIRELRAIQEKTGRSLRALALQGRHRLCLKLEDAADPELVESTAEELSHYCSAAKRATEEDPKSGRACSYYAGLMEKETQELASILGPMPLTAEAFREVGRGQGLCTYEATKRLLPSADVVVAPYVFAFEPGLRQRLLQWWATEPQQIILVVDEAHNLPGYLRELSSPRLGKEPLRRALSESESLHHPMVARDTSTRMILETLASTMDRVVEEYAKEDDGFVAPYEIEEELLSRFRLTSRGLIEAAEHMVRLGETIRDRRRLLGKIPKSSLSHVALFIQRWVTAEETTTVKLAVREPRPYLEAFCVDATSAAQVLQTFHATIHASGTLAPLAEYRDTLGLGEEARLERFPSPFPEERRRVVVAEGVTTKYERIKNDPRMVDMLQEAVRAFLDATTVSAAVFFPSHAMLEEFREVGALGVPGRQLLVESRELAQDRLMQMVAAHRNLPGRSILAGVLGGRLSEGLDFPGKQLEALLIIGVPFPKPTARQRSLFRYYEARHGKGWEYAVRAPALRRLRQALGRLVRSADDRGFAFILDERAAPLLMEGGIEVETGGVGDLLEEYRAWQAAEPVKRRGELGPSHGDAP